MGDNGIVIIGSGLAGYNLAREFRKLDTETCLTLITSDDGAFYSKPMLSNALAKQKQPADLPMANADKMAADLNATILTNKIVTKINREKKLIQLDEKEDVPYDKLVLTIGASPITFPMEGDGTNDVLTVNDLDDYAVFRHKLKNKQTIAIIGPGLIGCEFANDLITNGYSVHVIGPDEAPMSTLLPTNAGVILQNALSDLGVCWHLQKTVKAVHKSAEGYDLSLSDDSTVNADLVLSAIGLRPNTSLAKEASLEVDRGIIVNRELQTSDEDIYALGDCAQVEGLVLPFVMPLMNGARALAKTLTGEATQVSYPAMPVLVKTPAMNTVVLPAPRDADGQWHFTKSDAGIKAEFKNGDSLLGFALLGDAVAEKQALTKLAPATLK